MRAFIVLLLAVVAGCARDEPAGPSQPADPGSVAAAATDPVILAAGDLVCGTGTPAGTLCKYAATAALVAPIAPAAVLLLGDIQYENATLADFNTYFGPTWGAHKAITRPAAGNHEYNTAGAVGILRLLQRRRRQRAGRRPRRATTASTSAPGTSIALNSNCASIGGCGAGSPQEQWLRADLAAHPAACTLAYWHHPRFSSGRHGNNSACRPLWQALYDAGADLVLAGHDHDYERFAPADGRAASSTPPGASARSSWGPAARKRARFGTVRANSEVRGPARSACSS